ncbi:MAG: rubrerythrin family protein [bacterium]
MKKMTEQNLRAAFAGESQAHMRYLIFSERAERENKKNLARLFKAIAFAEQVHATNHYRALGEINDSSKNLQAGIDGETYEVEEMYPAYNTVAELQKEQSAVRTTHFALEAEKIHMDMYKKAKQVVDQGKDIEIGDIYICDVCGYTVEGKAPDVCPVCGAKIERFKKF